MSAIVDSVSSSLSALTQRYQTITQNLANSSADGYKRRCTAFSQVLAGQMPPAGGEAASTAQPTIAATTAVDFSQGSLVDTRNPLDLALDGKGFFVIETPAGPLYTRSGGFALNGQGQLVDRAGKMVAGAGGPIVIPPSAGLSQISVSREGEVTAAGASVGRIKIVEFENPGALEEAGGSHFRAPPTVQPSPAAKTVVHQGYQESSNVNVVEELVGLITVSRLYEASLKGLQSSDERSKSLISVAMQ